LSSRSASRAVNAGALAAAIEMKRPASFVVQERSEQRRRRALSEEERALWDSVARQVKPLRKKPRAAKLSTKSAASAPVSELPVAVKPAPPPRPVHAVQAPKPSKPAAPPLAPLGRRERTKLSKGRNEIDARLDLHGMTQVRAHHALFGFLQRAHRDGLTFVLVITGKGKVSGAESERGVLRRQVPQWLSLPEFRSLVVGFEEAHIGHGGEGALYVRVRRAKI
jgi:DNA-nicking Smr family endonuclease